MNATHEAAAPEGGSRPARTECGRPARPRKGSLSGLLPVNKPAGMVSKDVSRWLVKRLGRLHIGHVGTLDPAASGVLPILLGRATRLQDHLLTLPKTYDFDITFGHETDTLDRDGKVCREAPWEHLTSASLTTAIASFVGDLEQTPPLFSAVKYKGKPLYDYAREEKELEVPLEALKRHVHVSRFELLGYDSGVGQFRVTCSKGTYVRSLVKDVATKVGSCGTLTRLSRTQAAGIDIAHSYGLEELETRLSDLDNLVVPIEKMELSLPRWRSPSLGATARLRNGLMTVLPMGEFVKGLDEVGDASVAGWARTFLLLGEHGNALGIGTARRTGEGQIALAMKRGL